MKKTLSLFLSAVFLLCFSSGADVRISAHEPDTEFVFKYSIPDLSFEPVAPGVEKLIEADCEDGYGTYVITGKVTVREDTVIPEGISLYIRDGGSLIIKNGAEITSSGKIVLERGGKLFVTDGTLTANGTFYNYGKLTVRKNGVFRCYSPYSGNAGSRIVLEGEAYFGWLALGDAVRRIQKIDPEFRLKNYCIESYNYEQIYFYYCIGNVRTDYYYRTRTDMNNPKYERKKLDLKMVYSGENRKKVSEAAEKDYSEYAAEISVQTANLFQLDTSYQYSYKKDRLTCEWTWFEYDSRPDSEQWREGLREKERIDF